jgi:hypothetical protein
MCIISKSLEFSKTEVVPLNHKSPKAANALPIPGSDVPFILQ